MINIQYHFIPKDDERKSFQLFKLQKAMRYLMERSTFYQNHFSKNGIQPSDIKSLKDFSMIPTITKAELQRHERDFWCIHPEDILDFCSTSGSEGRPLTVPLTDKDLKRLANNERRAMLFAGIRLDDVCQLTTTIDRQFMAGRAYMEGARKLGAAMLRCGSGLPEMQWETAMRMQSTVLIAVPSFIVRMLDYADAHNIEYRKTSIRMALCIGDPIRNADFTLNALGQRIADRWDISLFATYASTEMATAFTECEAGNGGHIQTDLIYAEILDEDGNEMPDGVPGELTITTFGIKGMPLLRFRTGDICAMHSTACACTRSSPRLGPIIGRKNQMIKYKGTTCYPPAIFAVLDGFPQIKQYCVELGKDTTNGDKLTVRYSLDGSLDAVLIADKFRASLRFAPELIMCSEAEIMDLVHPKNSRKALKFIDRRGV